MGPGGYRAVKSDLEYHEGELAQEQHEAGCLLREARLLRC
jgi:hypothetical protein